MRRAQHVAPADLSLPQQVFDDVGIAVTHRDDPRTQCLIQPRPHCLSGPFPFEALFVFVRAGLAPVFVALLLGDIRYQRRCSTALSRKITLCTMKSLFTAYGLLPVAPNSPATPGR